MPSILSPFAKTIFVAFIRPNLAVDSCLSLEITRHLP